MDNSIIKLTEKEINEIKETFNTLSQRVAENDPTLTSKEYKKNRRY